MVRYLWTGTHLFVSSKKKKMPPIFVISEFLDIHDLTAKSIYIFKQFLFNVCMYECKLAICMSNNTKIYDLESKDNNSTKITCNSFLNGQVQNSLIQRYCIFGFFEFDIVLKTEMSE